MQKQRIERITKKIRADQRVKKLKRAFDTLPQYQIPFKEHRDELRTLHNTRKIKALTVNNPKFINDLATASIQDTANRGRMTELLVQAVGVEKSLRSALDALKDYIMIEYSEELKIRSTKGEREAFVESILRLFYSYLRDVEQFTMECRLYIEDIDKASFTVKHLVDAFAVIRKAEGTVKV